MTAAKSAVAACTKADCWKDNTPPPSLTYMTDTTIRNNDFDPTCDIAEYIENTKYQANLILEDIQFLMNEKFVNYTTMKMHRQEIAMIDCDVEKEYRETGNMEFVMTHRGKPMTAEIKNSSQILYSLPLTGPEMNIFLDTYYSDFFEGEYARLVDVLGADGFVKMMNDYLFTCQYKNGTMDYYRDQVFGTRRRRDALKTFMDKRQAKFLADIKPPQLREVPVVESLTHEGNDETGLRPRTEPVLMTTRKARRWTCKDIRIAHDDSKTFLSGCIREAMKFWSKKMQERFMTWFTKKMNRQHIELEKDYDFDFWTYHENNACFRALLAWNRDLMKTRTPITAVAESAGEEGITQQSENTTFTDQRETVTDEGYVTTQETPALTGYSMPEEEWHVRNIMAKPIPFYQGQWKVGDTTGTILKRWSAPGDMLVGPHYNLVSTFTFFRGNPRIRIQLNGTKFHAGRLIFAFIPFFDNANYEDKLYDVNNFTALPHVILDAGIANSGELVLPFVHPNTYFNSENETRSWQSLGTLICAVYNKLAAADTSSQTITYTAWISYDACELHQPCHAHNVTFPKYDKTTYAQAESLVEGVLKSAVPLVKDLITPEMTSIGSVLGGAADQDKPTDPIEISRWVPNTVTGLARGDGIDRCDRLCLQAGGYTVPDADLISTTVDDMDLKELVKIPTRVRTVKWNINQRAGSRILHIPVHPTVAFSRSISSSVTPSVDVIGLPLLGYISRAFKYWRGGLRYKIQIVASQMHTGRLMISYGAGLAPQSDFAKSSYVNTMIIDLQEKHEVEFVVPFLAEKPWLRSDFSHYMASNIQPSRSDPFGDEFLGYMDVYILNDLVRPDSIASEIDINVLVSAADDYELAFPSDFSFVQGIGEVITTAFAESLTTQDTVSTRTDEGLTILGKGSGRLTSAGPHTMGEDAMKLKTLLRRYTKMYSNNFGFSGSYANGARVMCFQNSPAISGVNKCFNNQAGIQNRTMLTHFSELFTYWRGSLRYKLIYRYQGYASGTGSSDKIAQNPGLTIKVFHMPGVNLPSYNMTALPASNERAMSLAALENYGVEVAVTDRQGSLEFEIPFYTPFTQLKTLIAGLPSIRNCTGSVVIYLDTTAVNDYANFKFDLYQAAGDDFTLNYLRTAPQLQWVQNTELDRSTSNYACKWPVPLPTDACVKETKKEDEKKKEDEVKTTMTLTTTELPSAEGWTDNIPVYSSFKRTFDNVNNAADNMSTVSQTANHLMLQAAKKIGIEALTKEEDEEGATTIYEDAASAVTKLTSPLTTITDALLGMLKSLPDSLKQFLNPDVTATDLICEISNLVCGITTFAQASCFVQRCCAIVTIVSVLIKDISTTIRNHLYRFVAQVVENFATMYGCNEGNEQPNAESLSLDVVAPLAASMVVGLGIVGLKKIPTDKETLDMCKGISEKLRLFNFASIALSNFTKLWHEVKELTQWCMDWMMEKLNPHYLAQLKLEREFGDIEEWTAFIDSLDNLPYTDMIHYNLEFKNKVYKAIDQGVKYNNLILAGNCGRAAAVVRQYCMKAVEIGHKCANSKNELPYRIDPYCVCITGESNIGKSGCVTTMGYGIMDALGFPLHNRWCAINCSESFFSENYRQQAAVYFDDFSTFTSEEQYNKFMNLKANTALPLNMAFRKGEYFNSSFIFMTTNTAYPQPNFVTNHDALLRRRDALVEADWIDDEELQNAKANGENMMKYRKLDNSHLKFRFLNSTDSRAAPGPWMNFDMMCRLLTDEARAHLDNQQRKLTEDLRLAGYILPNAEGRTSKSKAAKLPVVEEQHESDTGSDYEEAQPPPRLMRRLCVQSIYNSPTLKPLAMTDPILWNSVKWNPKAEVFDYFYDGPPEHSAYTLDLWKYIQRWFEATGMNLQETLRNHSYIVKDKPTTSTKITEKLSDLHEWLGKQMKNIGTEYPWVFVVAKWGLLIAGALAASVFLKKAVRKVVHKCACGLIRYFGFRCGICGKWPALKNVSAKLQTWMLNEWAKLYGNEDYIDGHITRVEEEQALRAATLNSEQQMTLELGTKHKAVAEGIYSDVTKGHGPVKVLAQSGQYSDTTKGQKVLRTTAESSTARQADTMIQHRILPYIYRFKTRGGRGISSQEINGFAIGDRKVLINSHFFYGVEEGDIFECNHNHAWIQIEFLEKNCQRVPNKDLVIYEMPKAFHQHRSNVNHFISDADLPRVQAVEGSLCKLTAALENVIVENLKIKPLKDMRIQQTNSGHTETYFVQDAWRYAKCSSFGDCGSPLVCVAGPGAGKILGLHTASTTHDSFAQLVTKEMLEGLVKTQLGTPLPEADSRMTNRIPPGHLGRIGCVLPNQMMIQNDKTQIIPTAIQGMVTEPETFPTVLSKRDPRLTIKVDPMAGGIAKYSKVSVPFPDRHRQIVNEMMHEEVKNLRLVRPKPRPTTWEQACFGDEDIEGFERLPKNTSPGYPWVKTRPIGETGKTYLFDLEQRKMTKELEKVVLMREDLARRGERKLSIWVDCLKDERRSLEKIQTGKTRLFTVPPVDYSLVMRKYTMDFSAAIWNSRSDNDCKVGIDPQSLEWTTLYRWLAEFSPYCVAGDFSEFDGSMPADIIDDVRGDIDVFYDYHGENTDEDRNVRKVLFEEVIHTVHLARDEVYMTHIGNKSGNPITVILNSRVNKRYMALAWIGLAEELGKLDYATMAQFRNNVRCAIYGDDNILAIKPEVIDWFNQETISEYLAKFNIIYTNEQKTGVTKYKKLDECTFLKQGFKNHESISMIKVPHMAMKTITELINWTRLAPDQDELLLDNCNDALRFMYFYGKDRFNELRDKIQAALLKKEKRFYLQTYTDLHLWFLNVIGANNIRTLRPGK